MEDAEYREVIRGAIAVVIGSIIFAGIGFFLSVRDLFPLDAISTALLGFFFFFCIGPKFFPDSTKIITRRTRNYRRAKKGLGMLDVDDEPTSEIITDFQRKQ